jgi:integrase
MGRRNKAYSKDLHQQAYDRLTGMQAFGESKKEAVANGTEKEKIFSFNTYKSYWKHTKYFIKYIKENHPECTTLKSAKKYVNEWLQARMDQGLSAWTVQLEAKAMGKLYGISPDDENYFKPPKRNREDIKRSRGDRVRDKHFSKTNNDELIKFCKGTGLRRAELGELRGKDLVTREEIEAEISQLESRPAAELTPADTKRLEMLQDTRLFEGDYFTHVRNGKGGRARLSPIIGPDSAQIIERMQNTPGEEKVWQHVHKSADIHGYRAEYATAMYKAHARPIEEIPYDRVNRGTGRKYQSEVYTCRKDEAGRKLDKAAMLVCSKALGHNRISVVADNYIRGL